MKTFHLHLVSDSTGDTAATVARASLVQFQNVQAHEHIWNMVRHPRHIEEILSGIETNPGFVLITLVNPEIREQLEEGCRRLGQPCVSILDPVVAALRGHLDIPIQAEPGKQHALNDDYFARIDAIHFALSYDDGQITRHLDQADVILLGVSRTSKTPTCMYLANRGVKAANIPLVPGVALPDGLTELTRPLIVGLTQDPRRLAEVRRHRLEMLNERNETDYADTDKVAEEIRLAQRLFHQHGWPIIDVSRKSIEEVAATILKMYKRRKGSQG